MIDQCGDALFGDGVPKPGACIGGRMLVPSGINTETHPRDLYSGFTVLGHNASMCAVDSSSGIAAFNLVSKSKYCGRVYLGGFNCLCSSGFIRGVGIDTLDALTIEDMLIGSAETAIDLYGTEAYGVHIRDVEFRQQTADNFPVFVAGILRASTISGCKIHRQNQPAGDRYPAIVVNGKGSTLSISDCRIEGFGPAIDFRGVPNVTSMLTWQNNWTEPRERGVPTALFAHCRVHSDEFLFASPDNPIYVLNATVTTGRPLPAGTIINAPEKFA